MKTNYQSTIVLVASLALLVEHAAGFSNPSLPMATTSTTTTTTTMGAMIPNNNGDEGNIISSRREWFSKAAATAATAVVATATTTMGATPAVAAEDTQKVFAPGGTLVDYKVGVTVGNNKASKSRRSDNSNVVFNQDFYYKFGTAPQFIPIGDTSFPVKMPFVFSQQRYDSMKKYRERVQRGIDLIASLQKDYIETGKYSAIPPADSPEYSIRPFGLLANGFLASENTGTTNELYLARWYINEIYLDIDDIRNAKSKEDAETAYSNCFLAMNSYLGMLNRSIISKVGDPFDYLGTATAIATTNQQQQQQQQTPDDAAAPATAPAPANEGGETTTASLPEAS